MDKKIPTYPLIVIIFFTLLVVSCKSKTRKTVAIVKTPQEMQATASELIRDYVEAAVDEDGKFDDSTQLSLPVLVKAIYDKSNYQLAWSSEEKWKPAGDSLYKFIEEAQLNGLFPEDYHVKQLMGIRERFSRDTAAKGDRKDAAIWSRADIMLTDAFVRIIKDVKLGRLPQDSITLRKDSVLNEEFYTYEYEVFQRYGSLARVIRTLEPKQKGYHLLKEGIKKFLDSADNKIFTIVPFPKEDSANFKVALQRRLFEGGFLASDSVKADSAHVAAAIKKFQQKVGIAVDGRAGEGTVRMLNTSDREKFIRIAISMDKYKMLPEKMPPNFIWVNLPGYNLQVWENDSIKFSSKIICGKAVTKTPQLTSAISEMITYPQWSVPTSIIVKEILPAVKKNPGYLAKKDFSLLDKKGDEVDPYSVDWKKYHKGIPYRVVQGSGDANALGIFKFNFNNKYAVYLHDTNQRYLFAAATRALSHGCVRVQEWEKLANYILENDNKNSESVLESKTDSMYSWLKRKVKRSIPIRTRLPVFIRYITCEAKNGTIIFYDDVYGEDKRLKETYFAGK